MGCNHESCGDADKVWLLHTYRGLECGLKPHPYCAKCGEVKNLSSEKPRNIGYYINAVAALSKEVKIAQVQMRLLCQEMEKAGLDDAYGMDREQQERLFIEILKRCLNVSENSIRGVL
jgi:hypothetical protein